MINKHSKNFVYICSPNTLVTHVDNFRESSEIDLLIIDEGHKAKNVHTKIRKALKESYVKRQKILLTGTPV